MRRFWEMSKKVRFCVQVLCIKLNWNRSIQINFVKWREMEKRVLGGLSNLLLGPETDSKN